MYSLLFNPTFSDNAQNFHLCAFRPHVVYTFSILIDILQLCSPLLYPSLLPPSLLDSYHSLFTL